MKREFSSLLLCLSIIVSPVSNNVAHANDGFASIGAGGITIGKTNAIRMEEEDLFISQDKIKVTYLFRNITDRAVKTRVAFPIAPMSEDEYNGARVLDIASDNPLGFSVVVDGEPLIFETESKRRDDKLHITHHWEQIFPAGKTVKISHSYTPASGGSTMYYPYEDDISRYCIEPGLETWMKKNAKPEQGKVLLPTHVDYILTTANSWHDSIGKFRLTIKKNDPEEKVSLCADGIKKVDEMTFVWEQNNFQPKQDLHILWVRKHTFNQ